MIKKFYEKFMKFEHKKAVRNEISQEEFKRLFIGVWK